MGVRKDFICGGRGGVCVAIPPPPPHESVIRVGSEVEVWNPDSSYWVECRVLGFRTGVGSLDGVIVGAGVAGAAFSFVPWTLIR